MRVTNNMMVNTLMGNLTRNMNRMSSYQDQLATGKRVINASDDPVGTSKILKYKSDIAALSQYEKNTGDSLSWLEVTETTISDVGDVLQRMRELSVQAANGTNTTEDTKKISVEIQQLKEHLINNGNFSYAGRYAFSGYQTDIPLFNPDGTYRINVTNEDITTKPKLQYQVSIGQDMDVTTNGLDVFGYVPIVSVMTQRFPDGITEGADGTKAVLKGAVTTSANLTSLDPAASMAITVGTDTFTLTGTQLQTLGTPIQKSQLLNLVKSADDGGPPPSTLDTSADVFFDESGKLTIRSRQQGSASLVSVDYSSGVPADITAMALAFGIADTASNSGLNATNAVATGSGAIVTAADITALENQKFLVTYNGTKAEINLGTLTPATQATLKAAIEAQTNSAFGAGNITVSFDASNQIVFTGAPKINGEGSVLEVQTIRATESQLMADIDDFITGLQTADGVAINSFLTKVDGHLNQVLAVRADIGARVNRMELVANRISDNTTSYTKMLSDVQDADMAGVIMFLKNAENVYKAALSTGSKVIQPSLIDFLS